MQIQCHLVMHVVCDNLMELNLVRSLLRYVARTIVVNWPPAQVYGDLTAVVAPWPDVLDVSLNLTMLQKTH